MVRKDHHQSKVNKNLNQGSQDQLQRKKKVLKKKKPLINK
jgi:hypothetical protein